MERKNRREEIKQSVREEEGEKDEIQRKRRKEG